MPRLALYTFGVLKSPLTDPTPLTGELLDRGRAVYRHIGEHPGYLGRAEAAGGGPGTHFDLDWGAWGEFVVPAWYGKGRTVRTAALDATLSLWTDSSSACDAIYTGVHREALSRRYDWFERTGHPSYVCWWVSDDEIPRWVDGVSKLEHLHDHGSAPHAFTFHHSFTPQGTPATIEALGPRSHRVQ
ncbi:DUF3291 domain-containing protein [Streptomyces sp. NBC_00691]|uniref:DUF3291 domain-containing protein n=1 Tax=Streptomyces sp. NBC_00691 TaxID=2903671 RepID=UPI002E35A9B0|nr:DUF3291 domain-containing protein [Streptomyces sp. NBC_00691]